MHFAQHTNVPPNPRDSHRSLCLCASVVVVKDNGGSRGGGGEGGGGLGRGCESRFDATPVTASLTFLASAALPLFNFSLDDLAMMSYLDPLVFH